MNSGILPRELEAFIGGELAPGERIVWGGQPIPAKFSRGSIVIVIFGGFFTAFALFWTAMALSMISTSEASGDSSVLMWFFPLFGVPFILVGMAMLSLPYWMRRQARRTAYVITDRRAIMVSSGWRNAFSVRSFAPHTLTNLERTQNPDGSGDLIFDHKVVADGEGGTSSTEVGFTAVPDVQEVEALLRQLARSASDPPPS